MGGEVTGEEGWLHSPAGQAWKVLYERLAEGYRWAPEQVAAALLEAERIVSASTGRVGPGAVGSTFSGLVGSGSVSIRFQPHEVTWAQGVALWPRLYLLDEGDPGRRRAERLALRLWLRRSCGQDLTPAEVRDFKSRAHRYARKRALVYIATGLMRDRAPYWMPGKEQQPDEAVIEPSPPPPPSPPVWYDEEAEPVTYRHDESPEELARLVGWIARDVLSAIATGERRSVALVRVVREVVEEEYANADGDLRLDQAKRRRETKLMDAVMAHINAQEREERREAAQEGG